MRTTLTIDDDVLIAVKERARRQKKTAGEVLSQLAREVLNQQYAPARSPGTRGFYSFQPFPRRGKAVSNALIDQIREDEGV